MDLGFLDASNEEKHVDRCLLFSPAPDFSEACSCKECHPKIKQLTDFEPEIKSKKDLVTDFYDKFDREVTHCLSLPDTAKWSRILLDMLHRHLKEVCEKLGVPFTLHSDNKFGDIAVQLQQKLVDHCLLDDDEVYEPDDRYLLRPISDKMPNLFFQYELSIVKDKGYRILDSIAKLEEEHETKKKAAQEHGEVLDLLISKEYIEEQIKLAEQLPVEELLEHATELIPIAVSAPLTRVMVREVLSLIDKTCRAVVRERNVFWQQHHGCLSPASESKGHHLNGLNETLDSLLHKIDAFKNQWEQKYAQIFTPFEQSAPKRQRTI